jgi:hypothetical protein
LYHISKINWDASIDKVRKRVGFGTIVRDYDERVLAMKCGTRPSINNPSIAEAIQH